MGKESNVKADNKQKKENENKTEINQTTKEDKIKNRIEKGKRN